MASKAKHFLTPLQSDTSEKQKMRKRVASQSRECAGPAEKKLEGRPNWIYKKKKKDREKSNSEIYELM